MRSKGQTAPALPLPDLHGRTLDPWNSYQGTSLLLVFFKISCPVCQLALPFLQRLAEQTTLHVIGISQNNARDTKTFLDRFNIEFPVLLDDESLFPASNAYGITQVPSLFLINDGVIDWASHGFDRLALEELGRRWSIQLFRPDENVPEWRPG